MYMISITCLGNGWFWNERRKSFLKRSLHSKLAERQRRATNDRKYMIRIDRDRIEHTGKATLYGSIVSRMTRPPWRSRFLWVGALVGWCRRAAAHCVRR